MMDDRLKWMMNSISSGNNFSYDDLDFVFKDFSYVKGENISELINEIWYFMRQFIDDYDIRSKEYSYDKIQREKIIYLYNEYVRLKSV